MQLQAAELFQGEQNAKRSIRHLKLAQQFLDRTREDLHRTVWDLRAFGPEGKSLTDALRDKARTMSEGNPVCITVEETGTPRRLPDFIAGNLLLIAQEAVTNALKHAGASTIAVQVTHHETGVMVSIRDDGKGFDPATVPDHHEGHFGLLGMRERAKRLGGTLEIVSTPGSGTRIEMQLPASDFREKNANY